MTNNKTIDVIKTFTLKRINALDRFLRSPYFNKRQDIVQLYAYLKDQHPTFKTANISKEKLFKAAFGNKNFDSKKLSYLLTDLQFLIDRFLLVEQHGNDFNENLKLMKFYGNEVLAKDYRRALKQAARAIDKYPFRDAELYYRKYLLEAEKNLSFNRQLKRTMDHSIQNAIDNLDIFYLATKLKYSCEILNRQNVIATEYQIKLVDELQNYLTAFPFEEHPVVHIYYTILLSLKDVTNTNHFEKLLELLAVHAHEFAKNDAKEMYTYALNYCARQINIGNKEFLHRIFEIYQKLIEQELLLNDQEISPWTFKNIIVVGLRLNKIEWVEGFIEDFNPYLPESFHSNALNYNLSYVHFKKKEYAQALELLQQVNFTDIYYSIDSKVLLLKTYYELSEYDVLMSHLDTFKSFLNRNKKVSPKMKTVYLNLVKYLQKSFKITDRKQAEDLIEQVQNEKSLADSSWLLEQLENKKRT